MAMHDRERAEEAKQPPAKTIWKLWQRYFRISFLAVATIKLNTEDRIWNDFQ